MSTTDTSDRSSTTTLTNATPRRPVVVEVPTSSAELDRANMNVVSSPAGLTMATSTVPTPPMGPTRPPQRPPPRRSNSLTRSSHVQFSLSRMASHETTEMHRGDTDEDDEDGEDRDRERKRREDGNIVEEAAEEMVEAATGTRGMRSRGTRMDEDEEEEDEERGSVRTVAERTPRQVEEGIVSGGDDGDRAAGAEGSTDEQHQPRKDDGGDAGAKDAGIMDQTNLLPVRQIIVVFAGLSAALFCSLLDQTIVSTALPTLGRVFNRADIVSWTATSYLITSTAFQPCYGRISDILGRKICLLFCLAVFGIGSIACAVSQTMVQLIVFRALSGVGGGGILTLVMIIVSDVVSLKDRGKYQGLLGAVVAMSNSIGPILGGVFTEAGRSGWRWCFWINVPLTAISCLVVIFLLPLKRKKGDVIGKLKRIDYLGTLLVLAWAVLILLPISWGGVQYEWSSAAVIAPLVIGFVLLGVFIWVEWKVVSLPIIPMHIFKDMTVNSAMVSTFFSGVVFYETLYVLPQFFQVVKGVSALRSGVLLLPLILVQTVTSFTSGLIVSRTGDYRINLYLGFAIWTIGLGLLSSIDQNTSLAKQIGYQILTGVGAGQTFQTSLVAIQATVARKDMASATGFRNFVRLLGGSVSLSVSNAILNNSVRSKLASAGIASNILNSIVSDPTQINELSLSAVEKNDAIDAYVAGIQHIFYFLIPCAGISFLLVVFFVKAHSLKREDDAALKAQGKAWAEKHAHKHASKHPSPPASRKGSVADMAGQAAEGGADNEKGKT